jgi:hypothetical protein
VSIVLGSSPSKAQRKRFKIEEYDRGYEDWDMSSIITTIAEQQWRIGMKLVI